MRLPLVANAKTVVSGAAEAGGEAAEETSLSLSFIMADIKARRLELGMTQKDLAELSGVDQPTLSYIERGDRRHSYPKAIKAISEVLYSIYYYEDEI